MGRTSEAFCAGRDVKFLHWPLMTSPAFPKGQLQPYVTFWF